MGQESRPISTRNDASFADFFNTIGARRTLRGPSSKRTEAIGERATPARQWLYPGQQSISVRQILFMGQADSRQAHNLKVIGSNPIPATRHQALENVSFSRAFCCPNFGRKSRSWKRRGSGRRKAAALNRRGKARRNDSIVIGGPLRAPPWTPRVWVFRLGKFSVHRGMAAPAQDWVTERACHGLLRYAMPDLHQIVVTG